MARRSKAGPGAFRSAHGTARRSGKSIVFESVPDGMRPADSPMAEPIEVDAAGRFTSAGARVAARRRHELAKLPDFAQRELEFVPFEGFAPFEQGRKDLLQAKAAEMVQRFGFVSPGVMTIIRGWSWMIAFAEHAAVEGAKTGNSDTQDRARRFFKDASIELAKAWETARVEAASRPKADPLAWLTAPAADEPRPPKTTKSASNEDPLSERHVAPAIDMVDGPKDGDK